MRELYLKDVRLSSVDDYQGEENDIIILSLVRSNESGDIGFLKVHKCVEDKIKIERYPIEYAWLFLELK